MEPDGIKSSSCESLAALHVTALEPGGAFLPMRPGRSDAGNTDTATALALCAE
jgi:hypothetical protein